MRSDVYGPWIPLRLTWRCQNSDVEGCTYSNEDIRGYDVKAHAILSSLVGLSSVVTEDITICGEDLLPSNASEVQFRWMNTADELGRNDIWAISNVTANLINNNGVSFRIFDTKNFK